MKSNSNARDWKLNIIIASINDTYNNLNKFLNTHLRIQNIFLFFNRKFHGKTNHWKCTYLSILIKPLIYNSKVVNHKLFPIVLDIGVPQDSILGINKMYIMSIRAVVRLKSQIFIIYPRGYGVRFNKFKCTSKWIHNYKTYR